MDYELITALRAIIHSEIKNCFDEENKINIEDYRDQINDMIYDYLENRVSISIEQ